MLKQKCRKCQKHVFTIKVTNTEDRIRFHYSCGHTKSKSLPVLTPESIIAVNGDALYDFQKVGVDFIKSSNYRCLIGDEMGLGKTIETCAALAIYRRKLLPALIVCKSSLIYQWTVHIQNWISDVAIQQVYSSKDILIPNLFNIAIVSMDTLWRMNKNLLPEYSTIIVDECHNANRDESARTEGIRNICREDANLIFLSGTPIKNRASEFYNTLNLLRPSLFPDRVKFEYWHIDDSSSVNVLADPEDFMNLTKDFILRRTRKEVLPDLPDVQRDLKYDSLGLAVEQEFKTEAENLQNIMDIEDAFSRRIELNRTMMRMYHMAGRAKVKPAIDFIREFLSSTDRKLVVFVQHHDVADRILAAFPGGLKYSGHLTARGKVKTKAKFELPQYRLMVVSTKTAEGTDMQFCSDCYFVERQWNPANEEQAEGRLARIGQKSDHIQATYEVALGTVDEYFAELVEEKRAMFKGTMAGESVEWNGAKFQEELANRIIVKLGSK